MKVLCVDRDPFQLLKMKREVGRIVPDARVLVCRNPDRAAELSAAEGCDVLLTGIDMGGGRYEGIDLALAVKEINPRVNIIFITVCDEREHAREIINMRASGYVRKPYKTDQIAREFANLRYAAT